MARWMMAACVGCLVQSTASQAASSVDSALLGGVTVVIQPAESIGDGAAWSIDGGPERASGIHEPGLLPGRHVVRFRDLLKWQEPDPAEVLVVGGRASTFTAAYQPLPSFYFKGIPEQHARTGKTVEFLVRSNDPDDPQSPPANATLSVSISPQPAGSVSFDSATGHFRYAPSALDRLPLTLTFSAGQGLVATTTITPLNPLVAEATVINLDRSMPDPESRNFMTLTETKNPSKSFNDENRETLTIDIAGHTLVFEAGHPAHLFEAYNERNNVEKLRLYADLVIIRSPLALPQTGVTIFARELRFERDGSINTTPKARGKKPSPVLWETEATVGINGDPAHEAGDVEAFVERFHSDGSQPTRFFLNGGLGGDAGEGRNGRNETSVSFLSPDWKLLMKRCGIPVCGTTVKSEVIVHLDSKFLDEPSEICGRKITVRGEHAIPSGKPGNGGAGGILRSTLSLPALAEQAGGKAGQKGTNCIAGKLSARAFVYRTDRTTLVKDELQQRITDKPAPKGLANDAPAPEADVLIGPSGTTERITDSMEWLHSFSVRSVIQFAKDAYLNGRVDEARAILEDYRTLVAARRPSSPGTGEPTDSQFLEDANMEQVQLEIETLLHRIDSNLDYFGNPAGFVPMLSFEANLLAFKNEVEQSIPVLYLASFLNRAATNLQASIGASTQAKVDLVTELQRMLTAFNTAQESIPRLTLESEAIALQIRDVRISLAVKLGELEKRARENILDRQKLPFWKKAIGVLSVAADLIPVGQPTISRIGSGLELLTQFDPNNPLESASTVVPKAFQLFSEKGLTNIVACFKKPDAGTNQVVGATNQNNTATGTNNVAKAKVDRATECGNFLGAELKQLSDLFKKAKVDKDALAAELEKLKAEDPTFKPLTDKLTELNAQKERFAQELAAAIQAVATLGNDMTENILATHEVELLLGQGLAALDQGALLHIRQMEKRAKDRLLRYQYFLAKSFQYLTLKAYTGDLQLTRLFDRFKTLVETSTSHALSADDFKNLKFLFEDELRQIINETFDNFNAPSRSIANTFRLTPEELAELNVNKRLVINLKERGLIPSNQENVRIRDLRALNMAVRSSGGTVGSHALVAVNMRHSGESRLTEAGHTFLFRHYRSQSVTPIAWNILFDGLTGQFNNSRVSPSEQSLLTVLLDLEPGSIDELEFFSRPAAWADIVITKEVLTSNGIDMTINDLQLQVDTEFNNAGGNVVELEVSVSDDLKPRIVVSQQDIDGRQDGQGDFTRAFPSSSQVSLSAPLQHGQFEFDRWIVNGQEITRGQSTVSIKLDRNLKAEAKFRVAGPGSQAPVLTPVPAPPGEVGFKFPTIAGVRYTVEISPRVFNPVWTQADVKVGTGQPVLFTRPIASGNAAAFFRVRNE